MWRYDEPPKGETVLCFFLSDPYDTIPEQGVVISAYYCPVYADYRNEPVDWVFMDEHLIEHPECSFLCWQPIDWEV